MEESKKPDTLAVCKICGETKVRNCVGKFGNGRDKKYVDDKGKLWNGKVCGDCQAKKMNGHMKAKRNKDLQ
jgi:ribosomal protein L32